MIASIDDAQALFAGFAPCVLRAAGRVDCIEGGRGWDRYGEWLYALFFARHHAVASERAAIDDEVERVRLSDPVIAISEGRTAGLATGLWSSTRHPNPFDRPALPGTMHVVSARVEARGGCAVVEEGRAIACWDRDHAPDAPAIVAVPEGERAVEVALSVERFSFNCCYGGCTPGQPHACARLASGRVACWGWNYVGQLGDGTRRDSPEPVLVQGITDATELVVGMHHGCVLHEAGTVSCWGYDESGQLGDGHDVSRAAPVHVEGVRDVVSISAGEQHTCGLDREGRVYCWGDAVRFGMRAHGVSNPRLLAAPERLVEVSAGGAWVCARSEARHVYCGGWY